MVWLNKPRSIRAAIGIGLIAVASASAGAATIGSNYVTGVVTDVMGNTNGLMLRIDYGGAAPADCAAPPSGWMLISRSYPEMSSVVLSHWMTDHRTMTIYTGSTSGTACAVTAVIPAN